MGITINEMEGIKPVCKKLVNQTYQLAENAVESFRKQLILDEKREATIQK